MKKYHIILPTIVILGIGFYWFQFRPARIRQECSWVAKHTDAIAEVTQDEINRANPGCKVFTKPDNVSFIEEPKTWVEFSAQYKNICPRPVQAQPVKDWFEPASPSEYQFCVHSRGL